jgi:HD-GYP domain-containing protein (c-di-GMP phosphodiesterase class II)/DNA-binding CsgD family transcriptional regulator
VSLGQELGLDEDAQRQVYFLTLLGILGCTADVHAFVDLFGDELAIRPRFATIDLSQPNELLGVMLRHVGEGRPLPQRARMLARIATSGSRMAAELTLAHCEVAERLAQRLGFGPEVQRGLTQMFERWNGGGIPHRLKGEEIALPVRVAQVAQDAAIFAQFYNPDVAAETIRRRSGVAHDPAIAGRFCARASEIFRRLDVPSRWDAVLDAEPGRQWRLDRAQLDGATRAIADFVDLKSPYLSGHSSGVGELAAKAARHSGLVPLEVATIRRAGFVHDLGRVGVSAVIWGKEGPLTDAEWEKVRLHPYYTERVLVRSKALAPLGRLAGLHHERLDGSGYHRGAPASLQPIAARILAAADVYHALLEPRPYRPAHQPEQAANELRHEAQSGRLDPDATRAVLAAAGHRVQTHRRDWPGGLSEREVDVIRLAARGLSNRQMADRLSISKVTVGHHIQHIYDKIGVSTRAAATLFAMEHDLIEI